MLVNEYRINLIQPTSETMFEFTDGEYNYFTISLPDREALHMEEIILAYFLEEHGCIHIAAPIRNVYGEWFTVYDDERFLVLRHRCNKNKGLARHGEELANFHKNYLHYPYQPRYLSSYGQWKDLWISKLDFFEERFISHARTTENRYCQRLLELFPYMIGLSENAIQYMSDCERESRFGNTDRPTIVFRRYTGQLKEGFILPTELLHDHPVRDIAEWMRMKLFYDEALDYEGIQKFLQEYEAVEPISVFGWKLIYSRLLYPAQFFDLLEAGFEHEDERAGLQELELFCKKQEVYQKRVGKFFDLVDVSTKQYRLATVDWL